MLLLLVSIKVDGFRPSSLSIIFIFGLQIFGEAYSNAGIVLLAMILSIGMYFFGAKVYKFPPPTTLLSLSINEENDNRMVSFFRIKNSYIVTKKVWVHKLYTHKIIESIGITGKISSSICSLFFSYLQKYEFIVSEGEEEYNDLYIIFSHGKGLTPFMYTQLAMGFVVKGYRFTAIQHGYVCDTGLKTRQDIKTYRYVYNYKRANDVINLILNSNSKSVLLMGHCYGGATIVQAYHKLDKSLHKRIIGLALLDPWLIPLPSYVMNKYLHCPVALLACHNFVRMQSIWNINNYFCKLHKQTQYVILKEADHLHVTDLGYVLGNFLWLIDKPHFTRLNIDLNVRAITSFINKTEDMATKLYGYMHDKDYRPLRFAEEDFDM